MKKTSEKSPPRSRSKTSSAIAKVAIVMGSKSDLRVLKAASSQLKALKISHDLKIVSAHRTPKEMVDFAESAHLKYSVIIAGAGGAAHLPGMIASLTDLPVIGVPVQTAALNGLDSLLSIVQMPRGIPVATVGIDNGENAALLAARILASTDQKLYEKLSQFRKALRKKVNSMNRQRPFKSTAR